MDNLDKLALVPQAIDIIDNFEKFGDLQKTAILGNLDDKEVIEFCLDNPYFGNIGANTGSFVREFKEYENGVYKNVSDRIVRKLNIANLINFGDNLSVDKAFGSLNFLTNMNILNLKSIFDDAREHHYEFSVEASQVEELIKEFERNTKEDLINKVRYYSLSDSSSRLKEICKKTLEWVQEFETFKLNKDLFDLTKHKPNYSISYTYIDEDGLEENKDIPIFVLDTPHFALLYHNLSETPKGIDSFANAPSEFTRELANNPGLFKDNRNIYSPNISLSYGVDCINTFGPPDILLGFYHVKPARLLKTFIGDGHSSVDKSEKLEDLTFSNAKNFGKRRDNAVFCDEAENMHYTEVIEKRYLDGNNINFDYMMYIIDGNYINPEKSFELTKKWAAYYNVPILMVDGPALNKHYWNDFNYMLKSYDNLDLIPFSMIEQIFEDRYYFKHFHDRKHKSKIPSIYELTDRLFANKELNYNTAQNFVTLVDKLLPDYGWCGGCSEDEYKERRQKMQQYYNKCREVIKNSELSMSEDTYNNDKRL